jgi:hypothetical protein
LIGSLENPPKEKLNAGGQECPPHTAGYLFQSGCITIISS